MTEGNAILLPYQSELVDAARMHNVVVEEKSRRTGMSWAISWHAVMLAALTRSAGGMNVFYMGYEKDMTREFIEYCAEHAKALQFAASDVQETFFKDPENPDKDILIFRIDFASGFHISALPSVPRALRGKQGTVIIDEAAFHDDLSEVLKAAMAMRVWGGKVIIISTHDGDTNPFNTLVQDIRAGRKPYHLLRLTFDDAIAAGLGRVSLAKQGIPWTPQAEAKWRQDIIDDYGDAADEELFCIPSPSTGSAIALALIEARTVENIPVVRWSCKAEFALAPEAVRASETLRFCESELLPLLDALDPKTPHVFGEDFARSGDLTVIWPMAVERSLLRRTPFIVELRNVPFEQQKQILWFILDRLPRLRAGKMDATGNGQWLGEVTVQRYGSRIEAVKMSEGWYRDNMPAFKAAFEDSRITVPADREIHDDIRALKMVRGVIRVPDQRATTKDGSKRHGDAAVAGALAYAASRAEPEEYGYRAVPSPFAPGGLSSDPDRWPIEDEIAADRGGIRMVNFGLRGSVQL